VWHHGVPGTYALVTCEIMCSSLHVTMSETEIKLFQPLREF